MLIKPGKYIHFKGNEYEIIGTARHSETQEEMIVYRALYGDSGFWVRPSTMWSEIVEHNGQLVKRFTHEDDFVPLPKRLAEYCPKPEILVGIHNHSSPAEKIELFLSLFAGREDVFAKRYENTRKGISGYVPVCINEWSPVCPKTNREKMKCTQYPQRDFVKYDIVAVEKHLLGKLTVGSYPMFPDETCRFLVFDFDGKEYKPDDLQRDVAIIRDACNDQGISMAVERSRLGSGVHFWIFFAENIPASLARKFGSSLITYAMEQNYRLPFKTYDRMIPLQDTLTKDGLGNIIALPLQKNPRDSGNSVFIDESFIPYADQWNYLYHVKKYTLKEIEAFIRQLSPQGELGSLRRDDEGERADEKPWESKKAEPILTASDFPNAAHIVRANMLYIDKSGISNRALNALKRLAAFRNPDFYKAQAMRLSTHDKGQLRECGEFAQRKGYDVIKTYADRAISGKKADNRPQFMQMIADSKQKLYDVVIVWKIDRFSRDKYDSVYYKNVLKKNGVSVLSATEPIDDSPEGQLMESIFEGFSAYYLKDLSMKVSRGMTENALKCKFNGGSLTYGYMIDEEKHFQPDPVKALIVTDIFRRYASGESSKSILATLKAQGLKTNLNKAPTYSFVAKMLKNRRYLGEYRFRDTVIENAFAPLVEQEVFDKCQRRLAANQHRPGSFKPVDDKYLLTGKIFCGYCGGTMAGVSGTSSTGTTYRYYHCLAAKKNKTCDKKRTMKDFLESAVTDIALQLFDNVPLLNSVVNNCYDLQRSGSAHLPALERQVAQVQTEIDNIMQAIKQGIITSTTKVTLEELEQEKRNLETAIAKERMERPILSKEQIKYWICKLRVTDLDDTVQKQQLIDVFVNGIYVYNDKMVITFNYKDGDKCITFDEIKATLDQKKNPDDHDDDQSWACETFSVKRLSMTRF